MQTHVLQCLPADVYSCVNGGACKLDALQANMLELMIPLPPGTFVMMPAR